MPSESVAELLRRLRSEQGSSLRTVAEDLGVNPSHLSRIESGQRVPSPDFEERASDYYGLTSDVIQLAAGRVPGDVVEILRQHPELLSELRDRYAD
jgi:transcriptional regulator with XRE-family HTH domain